MGAGQFHFPHGRGATVLVAASDALAKSKRDADYVCDGVADQVDINAAIDALPATGGTVQLSEGTFYRSGNILISKPVVVLRGMGASNANYSSLGGTKIYSSNGANSDAIKNSGSAWRSLFLQHLTMDGNKANNSAGHAVNGAYLDIGASGKAGIFDVEITNFKQNGIHAFQSLSGSHFTISNCSGHGMYSAFVQGIFIERPCWLFSNAGDGMQLTGLPADAGHTDAHISAVVESNSGDGVNLRGIGHSALEIWSSYNGKVGCRLQGCHHNLIRIQSKHSCGVSAAVPCEVDLYNCGYNQIVVNLARKATEIAGIHGIEFYGNSSYPSRYNTISGNIDVPGYAIAFGDSFQSPVDVLGLTVVGCNLHGDLGAFGSDNGSPLPTGMRIYGNTGYIAPGEIRSHSGSIATLTENAFNSLDNPFGQNVALLSLDIYVATGATATSPNIDCGIGASATADYTNLFDNLPGETPGLYNSKISTPGAQTQPIIWQSGTGNRYLNMSIKDAAATGMIATYVATVMGL